MDVKYISTRNKAKEVSGKEAILKGLSDDGGLFLPNRIPSLSIPLKDLKSLSYQETAYEVMKLFLTDFTEEELKDCINAAYDEKFDTKEIAPIRKADNAYFLELFHGRTIAFKDMALSILPHLMITSKKKSGLKDEIVILTATSGDTGKAALSGFSDVKDTRIVVFYPKDGVSNIQRLQMVTEKGKNTHVVAIHGNFDEAQTGVKNMFNDKELKERLKESGFSFSSANSINIGRLIPQIVYYVYSYGTLLKNNEIEEGEKINVCVPTGNFGNILAAYFAKEIGIPIKTLICASNENKVLYDFFKTKKYDKNREFKLTSSPSMDILISSNLERLIFLITGKDDKKNKELMESLRTKGVYEVEKYLTDEGREILKSFYGDFATEEETLDEIRTVYSSSDYVIDPHTAVASRVYRKYRENTKDETKTVIASTASPYKFTRSVMKALSIDCDGVDDIMLSDKLSEISKTKIPPEVEEIKRSEILHNTECDADKMEDTVLKFLGI